MNDPLYSQLRQSNWRRPLVPGEEAELRAWLAAHPEMESDWETESGLSEALARLPDVEVPSNFTAVVVSRAVSPEYAGAPGSAPRWMPRALWLSLVPKLAFLALTVSLALFSYHQHQVARRAEFARKIATLSSMPAVRDPELLKDFDTIRRLDQIPHPDEQLLALLK
jgi:hypothetical protein